MFKRKLSKLFAERKKSKVTQSWTIAKTSYLDAEAKLKSREVLKMVVTKFTIHMNNWPKTIKRDCFILETSSQL